jgi:hypothetical protein
MQVKLTIVTRECRYTGCECGGCDGYSYEKGFAHTTANLPKLLKLRTTNHYTIEKKIRGHWHRSASIASETARYHRMVRLGLI